MFFMASVFHDHFVQHCTRTQQAITKVANTSRHCFRRTNTVLRILSKAELNRSAITLPVNNINDFFATKTQHAMS